MNAAEKTDREQQLTLGILSEIASREDVTQRHLADQLGVALGLANSYLKRCLRKGFIKIHQAPANRYLYYLTPKGFAEKSRLTARYLAYSFDFYRRASADMLEVAEHCRVLGVSSVLFAGVSELAEIGSIRMQDAGLELLGTVDPNSRQKRFLGRPVWNDLEECPASDVAVFTSISPDSLLHAHLVQRFGQERVHVPRMLQGLLVAGAATHGDPRE